MLTRKRRAFVCNANYAELMHNIGTDGCLLFETERTPQTFSIAF
jgi:hypothetical protein